MNYLLISCLLIQAFSGRICLSIGWTLEWSFPDSSNIDFKLILISDTIDNFGWVGIGLKYDEEEIGMANADITNFILTDLPTDQYSESNSEPIYDIDIGGNENIINPLYDKKTFTYTWTRPINSGDIYDKEHIENDSYQLLWACGQMSEDIPLKHERENRDTVNIELSEEFDKDCIAEA
ncbi:hypothetical protein SteCoe_15148 [Stentor coeruleus]|uniref:DOMON domain-containing protein n=1 Tax=Stentor coeruleus TaxID=5963 RepID=A0A1R2C4C7_9CILI|nr:hypothetical protein SteCoe_15148 [Stentor coeruleus]